MQWGTNVRNDEVISSKSLFPELEDNYKCKLFSPVSIAFYHLDKYKHNNFSYAGANKKKVENDKVAVINAITRSMKKERKVKFQVFTRLAQERGKFQLILECWTPRKLRKSKPKWENEGCDRVDGPKGTFIVDENQTFKVFLANLLLYYCFPVSSSFQEVSKMCSCSSG